MLPLKFHPPGLAPVLDASGAYHVNQARAAAYSSRFMQTFGFYDLVAAVRSENGWYHILPNGTPLYEERYAWCGNFQENHCSVRNFEGRYFHIRRDGKKAYQSTFKYAGDFRDSLAVVMDDEGLSTHIDFQGTLSHGEKFLDLDVFHKGYARAQDHKGWFHIDAQGSACYTARYKSIEPFYNGVSRVETFTGAILLINERNEILSKIRDDTEDVFHQVSADLVSYWRFYTLDAACALKIFDYLPGTTLSISHQASIPIGSAKKLLNALAFMEYVEGHLPNQWSLSNKGTFLTSQHPSSLRNAQKLWKEEHLTAWQHLVYSLKTEKPAFDHLFKTSWFDYLKNEDTNKRLYHETISTYARSDYKTMTRCIDFKKHRSIADVGGSCGALLFEILEKNTHLSGILLDLPEVLSLVQVPPHLEGRVKLVSANFFDSWPLFEVDCAILSRVLHDWSDQNCLRILKSIHRAVTDTLYVIENTHPAPLLDLNMLVMTEGHERTLEGFKQLLEEAQFATVSSHTLNEASTVLVAKRLSSPSGAFASLISNG